MGTNTAHSFRVGGSRQSWFASVNCEPVSQLCVQRGQVSSLKLAAVGIFTPQELANVPNQGSFPPQKTRSPTSPCLYWSVGFVPGAYKVAVKSLDLQVKLNDDLRKLLTFLSLCFL